jgi:hypothetical protein
MYIVCDLTDPTQVCINDTVKFHPRFPSPLRARIAPAMYDPGIPRGWRSTLGGKPRASERHVNLG